MADPNYPGADDEPSPSETPDTPDNPKEDKDENTALLPKDFFGDKELKPGNQCTIEIVRSYEDEVEVRYVKHEDESKEPEEESANSKLEAMGSSPGDSGRGY